MMQRFRPTRRAPAVWNPYRDMEDMERMMDENFGRPMMWRRAPDEEFVWAPAMEIYEKPDSYMVRMELPGIIPDEVEISVTGDTLTVKGERTPPEDIKEEEYQLCELTYGSFTRSVTLAEPVNPDKIEAMFDNGILDVYLPKAQAVKPKLIKAQKKTAQTQPKLIAGESSTGKSKSQTGKSSSKAK